MMNNIKYLRKAHKMSGKELGNAIGKSQATISKWERNQKLRYEYLKLIADYFNVPISAVCDDFFEKKTANSENMVAIEIIATKKNVKNQNLTIFTLGQQLMPLSMLREFTESSPKDIKIIRIENESMKPTINAGDMVWVDTSVSHPDNDGIYLINLGNNLVPKRILINPVKNSVIIKSDNPEYENFTDNDYNHIKVFGKVIYHIQKVV